MDALYTHVFLCDKEEEAEELLSSFKLFVLALLKHDGRTLLLRKLLGEVDKIVKQRVRDSEVDALVLFAENVFVHFKNDFDTEKKSQPNLLGACEGLIALVCSVPDQLLKVKFLFPLRELLATREAYVVEVSMHGVIMIRLD